MRLHKVQYSEFAGTAREWTLEGLVLGDKNLIVGRNASGKTRTVNVIAGLAHHLRTPGALALIGGNYSIEFDVLGGGTCKYVVVIEESEVISEVFEVDGVVRLARGHGGIGKIWHEALKTDQEFQCPPSLFAAVARRDNIQHSFLEPLHEWADTLRHFQFGTFLGKGSWMLQREGGPDADDRNPEQVVGILIRGKKEYGPSFEKMVIDDMTEINYNLESIAVGAPTSVRTGGMEIMGLLVMERDLEALVDQASMSSGMFRVLSLLIQINYAVLKKKRDVCVLIDDIGEGLDFDRSCRLIELLRNKAEQSDIQLVMTTNDRFVMNLVPLEEWSVLQRKTSHVSVRNFENSKDQFEEFKFTGLSNFSILELDFLNSSHGELH